MCLVIRDHYVEVYEEDGDLFGARTKLGFRRCRLCKDLYRTLDVTDMEIILSIEQRVNRVWAGVDTLITCAEIASGSLARYDGLASVREQLFRE